MASKASTTKSASKSATPKAPKQTKPKSDPVVSVQDTSTVQVEHTSSTVVERLAQQVWRASDHLTERVPVRSAIYGTLIYVDSLTHRKWVWTEFGQRHEIALEVLENARNTQPSFFIDGWWEIDSEYVHKQEVLDFLDAGKFYQAEVSIDNFDSLLNKSTAEISAVTSKLPVTQKVQLARRAQELINEGKLDSIKAIRALEKTLGVNFEM